MDPACLCIKVVRGDVGKSRAVGLYFRRIISWLVRFYYGKSPADQPAELWQKYSPIGDHQSGLYSHGLRGRSHRRHVITWISPSFLNRSLKFLRDRFSVAFRVHISFKNLLLLANLGPYGPFSLPATWRSPCLAVAVG